MKQFLLIGTALLSFLSYASNASSSDSGIAEHLNSVPPSSPSTNSKSMLLPFMDKISKLSSSRDAIKLLEEQPIIDDKEIYLELANLFFTKEDAFINDIIEELGFIAEDTNKLDLLLGHIRNIFIARIENSDKPFGLSLISKFNSIESPLLSEKIKKQVISPLPLIISNCKNYIEMYVNSLHSPESDKEKVRQKQLLDYYKKLEDDFKTSFPDAGIEELMKIKRFCISSIEKQDLLKKPESLFISEDELKKQINRTLEDVQKYSFGFLKKFDKVIQKAFVEDLFYEEKLQEEAPGSKLDQIADIFKIVEIVKMIKANGEADLESKVELLANTIKDLRTINPDFEVGQLAIIAKLPNVMEKFRKINPNFKIQQLINEQTSLILKLNSEFYKSLRHIFHLAITSEPLGEGYYQPFRQIIWDSLAPILKKEYENLLQEFSSQEKEPLDEKTKIEINNLVSKTIDKIIVERSHPDKPIKMELSPLFYDAVIDILIKRVVLEIMDPMVQSKIPYKEYYNEKVKQILEQLQSLNKEIVIKSIVK